MNHSKVFHTKSSKATIADVATDEQVLLNQIISTTMQTLHAEVCSIFLEDKVNEPGVLKCVAGSGFASKIVGAARYEVGEGFTGSVVKYGTEYNIKSRKELENLKIDGVRVWRGDFDDKQWPSGKSEFCNLLALPLVYRGEIYGVIKAENKIKDFGECFTDDDLLVLKTIADVISLALENARLHQRAEEQSRRVSTALAEIVGAVVERYDMEALLNQIINTMMRILNAEVCSIFIEDKENEPGVLKCVAGSGFASKIVGVAKYKVGDGFTGSVAKYGIEYNIKSREELEKLKIDKKGAWRGAFDGKQWPSGKSEFRNLLASPLKIKEQIFGVIKVENKIGEKFFSSEDEVIFKIVSNVIVLTIEKTRLQLQIEDQLKTVSVMAAHRINNRITRYDGIIFRLKKRIKTKNVQIEDLILLQKELAEATDHIKELVKEFNKYGKPIQLERKLSDINKIIKNEIWHSETPSGINIIEELEPNLPKAELDAIRFSESIKELIGNSIRAIMRHRRKGNVILKTKVISNKQNEPEAILISIEDTGPGFPNNFPIFAPFKTTYPQHTGLGLATVKETLEAHGGTIQLVEKDEMGACFELIVPIQGG